MRQASVWIVFAAEALGQKLGRICGLVVRHGVVRVRQGDDNVLHFDMEGRSRSLVLPWSRSQGEYPKLRESYETNSWMPLKV